MKMRIYLPLALLLSLALTPTLPAQQAAPDPGEVAAAEELLQAMGAEEAMQKSMDRMLEVQMQQNPMMASMEDMMREFFNEHLTWEQMKPEMLAIYTDLFSEAEIRELTDFYRTDLGRKLVEQMPEIAARSAMVSQRIVQEHMPELMQRMMQRMQEDPELMQRMMEEAQKMVPDTMRPPQRRP